MMRSVAILVLMLCCHGLVFAAVTPPLTPPKTLPTGALLVNPALGLDQSPIVPLLETRLADSGQLNLLERNDIARILKEQSVSQLFSPEGSGARVETGHILKADLLLILQAEERQGENYTKIRSLDLAVSETTLGIRALVASVPWTKDAEADAAALFDLLQRGIRKARQPMNAIFAVPPFVSNDLTHQLDYLQEGYARLVEQALLDRSNIVVVEFAEARAIGDEHNLAGGGVARRVPIYINGDFRHEGIGEQQQVAVHLVMSQGAKQLAEITQAELAPNRVGPFLLDSTDTLLAKAIGQPLQPYDGKAEAAQLAARAANFAGIANWQESSALLDAALLLQPDDSQMLYNAALAAGHLFIAHTDTLGNPDKYLRELALAMPCYQRMKDYLDIWKHRNPTAVDPYYLGAFQPVRFAVFGNLAYVGHHPFPQLNDARAQWFAIIRAERLHLLDYLEHTELNDPRVVFELQKTEADIFSDLKRSSQNMDEVYAYKLRVLPVLFRLYANFKDERAWETILTKDASANLDQADFQTPQWQAFLNKVAALQHPGITAAVANLRAMGQASTETKPKMIVGAAGGNINFTPVVMTIVNPFLGQDPNDANKSGLLPCGKGVDALWDTICLYLMKEPGKLKRVYQDPDAHSLINGVCYDGRYLWVPIARRRMTKDGATPELDTYVVVLDPVSEKTVVQITAADGLPPALQMLSIGLAPGAIILVGHSDRSWCAKLTLENGKPAVKVFHEARLLANTLPGADSNLAASFTPKFIVTLSDNNSKRVLVGRSLDGGTGSYPLLIDPDTLAVQLLPEKLSITERAPAMQDGALYFFRRGLPSDIIRLGLPDLKQQLMKAGFTNGASGTIGFVDNRLYYVNTQTWEWSTADSPKEPFTNWQGTVPHSANGINNIRIVPSENYGLVYVDGVNYYLVSFDKP